LGALPLFFEEGPRRGRPVDSCQLSVPDHDPLNDDPAEFLPLLGGRCRDRGGQWENARSIGVERPDPVTVWQGGEVSAGRIAPGQVLRVGQVAPGVLLLQLFEAGQEARSLAAGLRDLGRLEELP
jgi:hypothetical protein